MPSAIDCSHYLEGHAKALIGSYSALASCMFSNLFSVKGRDSKEEWWQLFTVNDFPAVIEMGISLSHVEHMQERLLE